MDVGTKIKKIMIVVFYVAIIKIMFFCIVSFMSSNEKYEQKRQDVKTKLSNIINKKP